MLLFLFLVKVPVEVLNELDNLRSKVDCCLVIDGESLQLCLDHFQDEFIDVATMLPAVVCCRCSPTQKVIFFCLSLTFCHVRS